ATLLEQFREGLLRAVEGDAIVDQPIDVAVFAGEDDGPARRADRIRAEAVAKEHALLRQLIDVRRPVYLRAIRANGMGRMIVAEDEENVRPRCTEGERRRQQQNETHENAKHGGAPALLTDESFSSRRARLRG